MRPERSRVPASGPAAAAGSPARAPSASPALAVAALALLALLLAACMPLYVPLVPEAMLTPEPAFRLHGDLRLEHERRADASALVLHLRASEVPEAGWLAVQWFGPSGPARAAESLWFEPADVGEARQLATPEHLNLVPGEWRAVLSWQDRLVRQVRITLP